MGYDMYLIDEVPGEAEVLAAATKKRDETLAARDALAHEEPPSARYTAAQQALYAAIEEYDKARVSYFRLNVWGMSDYREHMTTLGMVKDPVEDHGWPERPEGLPRDVFLALGDDGATPEDRAQELWRRQYGDLVITPEHERLYREYEKAEDAALRAHNPDVPGMTITKFRSNDGWIVTPEEITGALEMWELADPALKNKVRATAGDYWEQWIDFLKTAAAGSGFRVY